MLLLHMLASISFVSLFDTTVAARIAVEGAQTGIARSTGEVPARRNINDIYNTGGPTWTLLCRAMIRMQELDLDNPLSWFQIGAIHGNPRIPWDDPGASGSSGYCIHSENTFPTWHRSYVAVFEQSLQAQAMAIAEDYPRSLRLTYRQAAERLRLPYWGWDTDASVPPCVTMAQVEVDMPSGNTVRKTRVRNPLYSYVFPESVRNGKFGSLGFNGLSENETTRCPVGDIQRNMPGNIKNDLSQTFMLATTYDQISSISSSSNQPIYALEKPHNGIHVAVGGWGCNGHMSNPAAAAFDPMFWLHHCNVDRLFAMWQEIHPDEKTLTKSFTKLRTTFGTPAGTLITPSSPLVPFYGRGGLSHTSQNVADISRFGYTYEGINFWSNRTTKQRKEDMVARCKDLYGLPNDAGAPAGPRTKRADAADMHSNRRQYFAKVTVEMGKIQAPCQMNLYLGGQIAGTFAILEAADGAKVSGTISLNTAYRRNRRFQGGSFKGALVSETMRHNMQVEFVKADGKIIDPDIAKGSYDIMLEDMYLAPPKSTGELPRYTMGGAKEVQAAPVSLEASSEARGFSGALKGAPEIISVAENDSSLGSDGLTGDALNAIGG